MFRSRYRSRFRPRFSRYRSRYRPSARRRSYGGSRRGRSTRRYIVGGYRF